MSDTLVWSTASQITALECILSVNHTSLLKKLQLTAVCMRSVFTILIFTILYTSQVLETTY